jgi:malate permease and related proteins
LLLIPVAATLSISLFAVESSTHLGVILEAAMPSMVLGIVLADRFRLDSHIYAMAVTISTAFSLVTLPMWHKIITEMVII